MSYTTEKDEPLRSMALEELTDGENPDRRRRLANAGNGADCAEAKGYLCDEAAGGDDALSALQDVEYDMVVFDVMMPDMDGFSVLSELRRRGIRP